MKRLVFESLNEMNFQRKMGDPLSAMGIGKTQLIKDWLDEMGVKHYTINDDYSIDVDGGVSLDSKNLSKFPDYIQFNMVSGYFNCDCNQLVSLRGCPRYVGGSFNCFYNSLISLEGCPKRVGGYFDCSDNAKKFTFEDVKKLCDVKGKNYVR